jgi:hypothetical protein
MRVLGRVGVAMAALCLASGCGLLPEDDSPIGPRSWEEQAAQIDGIVNYRQTDPDMLTRRHTEEPVEYPIRPPVGGDHFPVWQNCQGDVYQAPIADETAVHSLEHGAVWITYRPDLPDDQVTALADRVGGNDKMLMSPYPNLDAPISLQAWGYQLRVESAADERIDAFIGALRVNASMEGPDVTCAGGITATG